jgi:hypothetical protein
VIGGFYGWHRLRSLFGSNLVVLLLVVLFTASVGGVEAQVSGRAQGVAPTQAVLSAPAKKTATPTRKPKKTKTPTPTFTATAEPTETPGAIETVIS